jgi:hypothetical protein
MKILDPPDFSTWTTQRIKSLLESYRSDLSSCRILLGKQHLETLQYEKWVEAMETELAERGAL